MSRIFGNNPDTDDDRPFIWLTLCAFAILIVFGVLVYLEKRQVEFSETGTTAKITAIKPICKVVFPVPPGTWEVLDCDKTVSFALPYATGCLVDTQRILGTAECGDRPTRRLMDLVKMTGAERILVTDTTLSVVYGHKATKAEEADIMSRIVTAYEL